MKRGLVIALAALALVAAGCTQITDQRCDLAPDPGPCDAIIAKYYFDGNQCLDFPWGGCNGTAPFDTLLECRTACVDKQPPTQHIVYTTNTSEDPEPYREQCHAIDGTFSECGSSCPPDAELCVAVCAFTCDAPLS